MEELAKGCVGGPDYAYQTTGIGPESRTWGRGTWRPPGHALCQGRRRAGGAAAAGPRAVCVGLLIHVYTQAAPALPCAITHSAGKKR